MKLQTHEKRKNHKAISTVKYVNLYEIPSNVSKIERRVGGQTYIT